VFRGYSGSRVLAWSKYATISFVMFKVLKSVRFFSLNVTFNVEIFLSNQLRLYRVKMLIFWRLLRPAPSWKLYDELCRCHSFCQIFIVVTHLIQEGFLAFSRQWNFFSKTNTWKYWTFPNLQENLRFSTFLVELFLQYLL
jgi:hypothetical protein